MAFESLNQNIDQEKQIIREILDFYNRIEYLEVMVSTGMVIDLREKKLIEESILSLLAQLKIINNAIPDIVNSVSFYTKINDKPSSVKEGDLTKVKYKDIKRGQELNLAIKKKEENRFLKSLSIHSSNLKKIEKVEKTDSLEPHFRSYISFSNRIFREYSAKLVEKGYFQSMRRDLRKITSPLIISSYISVMFFSTLVALGFGLVLAILFLLLRFGFGAALGIFFAMPIIIFLAFLIYPSSTRKGLEKNINQELPFLTIYMSAIATSGIEPSKIFTIIASSKEYPYTQREIRKLTNYLNFYGYDLVNALRLLSKNNPSDRLAQLLDGLSTTVTSGGEITEFLNKHSETLLFDYRLEREKYTRVTETLMNIYISVVIAAPMIMLVLFILMGLTSFGQGILNTKMVGVLVVLIISLLNVFFLVFLNIKQPKF